MREQEISHYRANRQMSIRQLIPSSDKRHSLGMELTAANSSHQHKARGHETSDSRNGRISPPALHWLRGTSSGSYRQSSRRSFGSDSHEAQTIAKVMAKEEVMNSSPGKAVSTVNNTQSSTPSNLQQELSSSGTATIAIATANTTTASKSSAPQASTSSLSEKDGELAVNAPTASNTTLVPIAPSTSFADVSTQTDVEQVLSAADNNTQQSLDTSPACAQGVAVKSDAQDFNVVSSPLLLGDELFVEDDGDWSSDSSHKRLEARCEYLKDKVCKLINLIFPLDSPFKLKN